MSSKQREAIAEMVEYAQAAACHSQDAHIDHYLSQIIAWGKKALNEPLRNCDIGTAEEQTRRMDAEYCTVQKSCYESPSGRRCPLYQPGVDCRLVWAQMRYKKGGVK